MAVTKYVPAHFAGIKVGTTPSNVFTPGTHPLSPDEEILTGVVLVNEAPAARTFSMHYVNFGQQIKLFADLVLPANSTTNLDLYLPLVTGQDLVASASVANSVNLTLYGLVLVEV